MPTTPDLADQDEATWEPHVGARVVLIYPDEFREGTNKFFPPMRYVEVHSLDPDHPGCFYAVERTKGQRHYVDPENYAKWGCSFRPWKRGDKWPGPKVTIRDIEDREKAKKKAKDAAANRFR